MAGDTDHQLTPKIHYQLASIFSNLNDFCLASDLSRNRSQHGIKMGTLSFSRS